MRNAIAAVSVVVALLAAAASSASAYPTNVTNGYTVGSVYGPCTVYVAARIEPAPAVIGRITATESVDCGSMTITPHWIDLSGSFGSTSLDVLNLTESVEPDRRCNAQKTCYWSRSKGWFAPGDHEARHQVMIDLSLTSTSSQQFTSVPGACRVAANDSGLLTCDFRQWLTMPAPAP